MAKISISTILGGFNLSKINNAIQTIVSHLNGNVLYRDSPPGEPNEMLNDLDMNGNRVYNLPDPVLPHEVATKEYVDTQVLGTPLNSILRVDSSELVNQLPDAVDRAGKMLTFDNNGQPELHFPANDSALQLRIDLAEYSGVLGGSPSWDDVPAHTDALFDVQVQALLNRIEHLQDQINNL